MKKEEKHTYKDSLKELVPYAIIIMCVVLIRTFLITPIKVNGTSMVNTLHDGDTMILNKINYKINDIKRFNIVVVKTTESYLIKRVIGLPGEKIKYEIKDDKGILYINGKKIEESFIDDETKSKTCINDGDLCKDGITIPNNYYFVMGDNRGDSIDSRIIGPVSKDNITGTTKLVLFPIKDFGIVK